jgi:hypothetical protein
LLLKEEYDVAWGEAVTRQVYSPPKKRAVPRWEIAYQEGKPRHEYVSRLGGLPNVPKGTSWPMSANTPMPFVLQLASSKASKAPFAMGDVHAISIFANMDGEYYHDNVLLAHRTSCTEVLQPPAGMKILPERIMLFTAGADDRAVVDIKDPEDDDELEGYGIDADALEEAESHAWCDKVGGVVRGANFRDAVDTKGKPMHCQLLLVKYDEWFLWGLFANKDFSEFALQIVRG